MTFFAKNLQRTKTGRVFIAIRDNDLAAEVMGINLFRYKLLAFFIGCFYAGIAGWLWAYSQEFIIYRDFELDKSIWYVGMLVIGGMGSTTGAILGTGAVAVVDRVITKHYIANTITRRFPELARIFSGISLMVFAVLVILFMIFEPRGLYHRWEVFKSTYRLYPYSY
jgi:branched-chain amino acid transport system permease protein